MPNADAMTLADAVIAAMNAGSFSQGFTSLVADVPSNALEDMSGVYVEAVISADSGSMMDRKQIQHDAAIDIGIQKKVKRLAQDKGLVDFRGMLYLVQQIVDFWWDESKIAFDSFKRIGVTNTPLYVPAWLEEKSVFFSVVHLTYRISR